MYTNPNPKQIKIIEKASTELARILAPILNDFYADHFDEMIKQDFSPASAILNCLLGAVIQTIDAEIKFTTEHKINLVREELIKSSMGYLAQFISDKGKN